MISIIALIAMLTLTAGLIRCSATQAAEVQAPTEGALFANDAPATLSVGKREGVVSGETVPVNVSRSGGAQLDTVTLYDGGNVVGAAKVREGAASVSFDWVALGEGQHLLSASTRTAQGAEGRTQVVGILVAPAPKSVPGGASGGASGAASAGTAVVPVVPQETVAKARARLRGADALLLNPASPAATRAGVTRDPAAGLPQVAAPEAPAVPGKITVPQGMTPWKMLESSGDYLRLSSLSEDAVVVGSLMLVDVASIPPFLPVGADLEGKVTVPPAEGAPAPGGGGIPGGSGPSGPSAAAPASTTVGDLAVTVTVSPQNRCELLIKTPPRTELLWVGYGSNGQSTVTALRSYETYAPDPALLQPPAGNGLLYFTYKNKTSPPMPISIPISCFGEWAGDATLIDGVLTTTKANGPIYVYVTGRNPQDKAPTSVRVPVADQTYINQTQPSVDISPYLPSLPGEYAAQVFLEVYGQPSTAGGQAPLLARGTFTRTGTPTGHAFGAARAIQLEGKLTEGGQGESTWGTVIVDDKKPRALDLRWQTGDSSVDHVVWQVLSVPLSPANADLNNPFVLATGIAGRTANYGWQSFQIPARSLDAGASAKGGAGWTNRPGTADPNALATGGAGGGGGGGAGGGGSGADPSVAGATQFGTLGAPGANGRVYIRVIGVGKPSTSPTSPTGLAGLGTASTLVAYDPPRAAAGPSPTFTIKSIKLTLPNRPYPPNGACIRVTQTPWDASGKLSISQPGASPVEIKAAQAFYPTPGMYCPWDFGYNACDLACSAGEIINYLAKTWDFVAVLYNKIIDTAAGLIAKLNPICVGAGLAGADSVQSACEKITKVVANVAIAAALTSFGLPPSLPTSSQVAALAQGNLEAAALLALQQAGVPCDSLTLDSGTADAAAYAAKEAGVALPDPGPSGQLGACQVLIHLVAEKFKAQVVEATSKQAAASTGMPEFPTITGLTVIPEPTGWLQPATLAVVASLDVASVPPGFDLNGYAVTLDAVSHSFYHGDGVVMLKEWGPTFTMIANGGVAPGPGERLFSGLGQLPPRDRSPKDMSSLYTEKWTLSSNDVTVTGLPAEPSAQVPFCCVLSTNS